MCITEKQIARIIKKVRRDAAHLPLEVQDVMIEQRLAVSIRSRKIEREFRERQFLVGIGVIPRIIDGNK